MVLARLSAVALVLLAALPAQGARPASLASREAQVAAIIAKAAGSAPRLRVLLQDFPKGGDLHNHLDGSVYAEDFLTWADADGDCIARHGRALTPPPCTGDQVPAKGLAARDPVFYQSTIDALSMRNFVPGHGTGELSGHDHTFATFPRFGAVGAAHLKDMMAATRAIAARDDVLYIEQIADPSQAFAPALLAADAPFDANDFARDLDALAPVVNGLLPEAQAEFDAADAAAASTSKVDVRYLFFVLRTLPPKEVFAQMALGFALAAADPKFVGVNFVAPEDDAVALRDFALHMKMFAFFHARYPNVKLSLHAGELALGLVPTADLGFHIRDTIEIAGASRIGHGYEIPYERDADGLLKEMAQKKIAVEINLTSNAVTHGLEGAGHPVSLYRAAHVPIVLSADDEGVFRIDLTHEYMRAVTEQHFTYQDLKEVSRNGIRYSFLPDAEKARLLKQLEIDFAAYETAVLSATRR
jgi:adenosine deaminase